MAVLKLIKLVVLRTSWPDQHRQVPGKRSVLFALLLTLVGSSYMFTVFSYIAPILQD